MLTSLSTTESDTSLFALTTHDKTHAPHQRNQTTGKEQLWCSHCHKLNHTKQTCWKLLEKLADWKPRNQRETNREPNRALDTETSNDKEKSGNLSLSTEQIKFLQTLLSNQNLLKETEAASSSSMAIVAHKSNTSISCFIDIYIDGGWIINTGTSDHMTGN